MSTLSAVSGEPGDWTRIVTPAPRRLVRLSIVARRFDVSVKTIRAWIRAGKLRAQKLPNGYWRVREDELEKIPSPTAPNRTQR